MAAAGIDRLADVTGARGGRRHRGRSARCPARARVPAAASRAARDRVVPPRSCSSTSRSSICGWPAWPGGAGVPVVYFIPPQVWAWRPWRARVDRAAASRWCWPCSRSSRRSTGASARRWSSSAIRSSTRWPAPPGATRRARRLGLAADALGRRPAARQPATGDRAHAARAARGGRAHRGAPPGHAVRAGGGADARRRSRSGQVAGRRDAAGPGRHRRHLRGHAGGRPVARDLRHRDARGGAARHADDRVLPALAPDRGVGAPARARAVDQPGQHHAGPGRRARALPARVHGRAGGCRGAAAARFAGRRWPLSARRSASWGAPSASPASACARPVTSWRSSTGRRRRRAGWPRIPWAPRECAGGAGAAGRRGGRARARRDAAPHRGGRGIDAGAVGRSAGR